MWLKPSTILDRRNNDIAKRNYKNAPQIDLHLANEKDTDIEPIIETLVKKLRQGYLKRGFKKVLYTYSMRLIVLNLIKNRMHSFMSIPLTRETYRRVAKLQGKASNTTIKKCLEFLEQNHLITAYYGSQSRNLVTRIKPKKAFRRLLNKKNLDSLILESTGPLLVMKNCNKEIINIEQNDFTKAMEDQILTINEFLKRWSFKFKGKTFCPDFKRYFNDESWTRGGRIYSSFQNLSASDRAKIKINKMSVVELDFQCSHLNIEYSRNTTEKRPFCDATGTDAYFFPGIDPKFRDLIKKFVQVVINTTVTKEAIKGINYQIFEYNKENPCERFTLGAEETLNKIVEKHHRIEHRFFQNLGPEIQFLDSEIALKIITYGIKENIPVLGVHDSFICPACNADWLRETMKRASREILGVELPIKSE